MNAKDIANYVCWCEAVMHFIYPQKLPKNVNKEVSRKYQA